MTQPDLHPDADTLNAFVEHALPAPERGPVITHMAGCKRCREIVYLAQAAAGPEVTPASAVKPEPRPRRFSAVFARWRVALVPAAALASVGAIVLWVQLHPAPGRMETAKLASPSAPHSPQAAPPGVDSELAIPPRIRQDRAAATPALSPPPQPEPRRGHAAKKPAPPAAEINQLTAATLSEQRRGESPIHLDARSAAMARYVPSQPVPPQAVVTSTPPPALTPFEANPLADPLRSASERKPKTVEGLPSPASGAAPGPIPGNAVALHGQLAPIAAGGPAQMAAQPAQLELAPQATNGFALMRLARRAKLPSGLNTVSSAALLNRLLAVDSAGSVFLSQDGGKRWEMVKPQWSGKAITVHAPAQNGHQLLTGTAAREDSTAVSGNSQKAPAEDGSAVNAPAPPPPADANAASPPENATLISTAAPGPPNLLFKLVTDRREVWVSLDGKVWRKQ